MLTIRAHQLAVFDELQEQRFRDTLRASLQHEYASLAELPPQVVAWLVDAGVRRARSFGFQWQSTIGLFIHLMAGIAPDFDLHPAIHTALIDTSVALEERVQAAAENLPESTWQAAEATASDLGWHLAQDSFGMTTAQRLALALGRALPQDLNSTPAVLEAVAKAALPRALALGLNDEDSQFVFAACECIYDAGFAERLDWAREVFGPDFDTTQRPALLRARVAIDTAVWL